MATFTHEHHLHLYGCLSATDVYALARTRWHTRLRALQRYAQRYAQVCGIVPPYREFWSSHGEALLREYYEISTGLSFAQFQAKFDLLIALFPLRQDDLSIWQQVLAKHLHSGLSYAEYRHIYPFALSEPCRYLREVNALLAQYQADSGGSFQPRLALSLARPPAEALSHYRDLRAMLDAYPDNLRHTTAIDLCGFEEDYPPMLYHQLFAEILHDNRSRKQKLAILLHVGESFQNISLASAIRRVLQAHSLGVHRIGHAIALGIDAANLRGTQVQETKQERLAHIEWLLNDRGRELQDYGYHISASALRQERSQLLAGGTVEHFIYDDAVLDAVKTLQSAALRWAKEHGMRIESCPTSNLRLAQLREMSHHPLRAFSRHNLCVTLASDDPGIFASDLRQEADFCYTALHIPEHFMRKMQANQDTLRSAHLSAASSPLRSVDAV